MCAVGNFGSAASGDIRERLIEKDTARPLSKSAREGGRNNDVLDM